MNCELYGGIALQTIVAAVFFAMQSAVFSVLLEWFYPIRNGIMLLLAGIVGTLPRSLFALIILLAAEIAVLLIQCVRC